MKSVIIVKRIAVCLFLFALIIILVGSCGKRKRKEAVLPAANSVPPYGVRYDLSKGITKNGFTLFLESASNPKAAGLDSYELRLEAGGNIKVEIWAKDKTAYTGDGFELLFDSSRFHPVSVQWGDFLGGQDQRLTFELLNQGEIVPLAIYRISPELYGGVSGSGRIVTVTFEAGASTTKFPSQGFGIPPGGGRNVVEDLTLTPTRNPNGSFTLRLSWTERFFGDYFDEDKDTLGLQTDGRVTAVDLSPIAFNFGSAADRFSTDQAKRDNALLDGNGDGIVNAGDVSDIALNWDASFEGYQIYVKTDLTDFFPATSNPDPFVAKSSPGNLNGYGNVLAVDLSISAGEVPNEMLIDVRPDNDGFVASGVGVPSRPAAFNPQIDTSVSNFSNAVGAEFQVDVLADQAVNLFQAGFRMRFDPAYLEWVSTVEGNFLGVRSATVIPNKILVTDFPTIPDSAKAIFKDTIPFAVTRVRQTDGTATGVNGSGIIATYTFRLKQPLPNPNHIPVSLERIVLGTPPA